MTIAAELRNGQVLVGQCEISHPTKPSVPTIVTPSNDRGDLFDHEDDHTSTDAMGDHNAATPDNVAYTKEDEDEYTALGSPIDRVPQIISRIVVPP